MLFVCMLLQKKEEFIHLTEVAQQGVPNPLNDCDAPIPGGICGSCLSWQYPHALD